MSLNIFFKKSHPKTKLPIERQYELVRIYDGARIHSGFAHNVCAFAMQCYRENLLAFVERDATKTRLEEDNHAKTKLVFRAVGVTGDIPISYRNGKVYITDWEEAQGWS